MQVYFTGFAVLCSNRRLGVGDWSADMFIVLRPTLLFSMTTRQQTVQVVFKCSFDKLTIKYPIASLPVQLFHFPLVFLSLMREARRKSVITTLVRFVTLLEAPGHLVAFFVCAGAERDIVLVVLVDLVLILLRRCYFF
jgi:hypothetical protein